MMPTTYGFALIFLIIASLLWGSWANTLKLFKGYRFELYYWDFVIAALFVSIFLFFSLGMYQKYDFTILAHLSTDRFRFTIQAFLSGVLFNIANFLLIAGVSYINLSFSYIMCFSTTLMVDSLMRYVIGSSANRNALFFGIFFLFISNLFMIASTRKKTHKPGVLKKSIHITIMSGILLGLFYPLLGKSLDIPEQHRLGPYMAFFIFTVGMFTSNCILNTVFMKRPMIGPSLSYRDYFSMKISTHIYGWIGGAMWAFAMCLRLISESAANPITIFYLIQLVALIAVFWGVLFWKNNSSNRPGSRLFWFSIGSYTLGTLLIGLAEFSLIS